MRVRFGLALAALLLALLPASRADDWPQFRGPNRDDVSKEKGLLKGWPKEGPKLLWTFTDAGIGYSGPAIVGKTLYTMGADQEKDFLFAIDLDTQKKLWSREVGPIHNTRPEVSGPRGTPTVDGDRVYALGSQGDLFCVEAGGGKKVWSISLKTDLGGSVPVWGYAESPLVDGDQVICTPGGKKGALAALDKKTGKVLWQSKDVTDGAQYSSVVISTGGGIRHYVQMTGASVFGVEPKDGALLWRFPRTSRVAAVPTPIVKDNFVYVASGYGAECVLLKLSPAGASGVKAEKVYANHNMENQHGGVVLVGDYLYGHWGSNDARPHHWVFQDFKTGDVSWESEKGNKAILEKGSITYADDRLYLYGQDKGEVVLLEPDPKGWKEHGRFNLPQKSKQHRNYWTHPVIANRRLYLRDQDLIFCYDIQEK